MYKARNLVKPLSDTEPLEQAHIAAMARDSTDRRATLLQKAEYENDASNLEDEKIVISQEEFEALMQTPKEFFQEIRDLMRQYHACKETVAEHASKIESLERQLKRKNETIARLAERGLQGPPRENAPSSVDDYKSLGKIADPPSFSNNKAEDKLGFDSWLILVKKKLVNDGHRYPTEGRKLAYITGLLRSPAFDLIAPRLDDGPQAYQTVPELYEHMKELWSNPNKAKDARAAFRALVMNKDQKFQDFYAEFTRLVAEGGISRQDLKDELYAKLWWKLQEAVAVYYNDETCTLHEFSVKCAMNDRQIRDRLDKYNLQGRSKPLSSNIAKPKDPKVRADKPKAWIPKPQDKPETLPAYTPSSIVCHNCKEQGHISRHCPKPKTRETKEYLAKVQKRAKEQAETDSSGSEDDSGKEDS